VNLNGASFIGGPLLKKVESEKWKVKNRNIKFKKSIIKYTIRFF